MKLKYKQCLEIIEKKLNFKINHNNISKIINVSANALSNRFSNDGYLKDEEIKKIEDFYKINITDMHTSANIDFFSDIFNFKNQITNEKIQIPLDFIKNFSNADDYFILETAGDTMSPIIKDKDKLLIKRHKGEQILDNHIYIFEYNNEIFIKRLTKNIDQIVIKSDNELYPTRILQKNEFKEFSIIGQIIGLIRDI